jgi:hypothetical protein
VLLRFLQEPYDPAGMGDEEEINLLKGLHGGKLFLV